MKDSPAIPTLDDVARAAGVSTATVSRCLNTPGKVSGATRDRVLQTIEALGYTPHFGARAMAARRTYTIGALIPTMENAIFARGIQAFQERLHAAGYTLLVASTNYRPEIEAEQMRALVGRGADGLLLIGYDRAPEVFDFLARREVPALVAWSHDPHRDHPAVGFDNRTAMAELANEVLRLGHRRIAMISGRTEGNDRAAERLAGVRGAMAAAGLDANALPVIEGPYEVEAGARAMAALMRADARPTAVICGNDVLAVGALQQAQEMGLDVPGDVSITGFDDIELARIVRPQLTTVHVPHREMGVRAAEVLVQMVETKEPVPPVKLASHIVLRGSLGPA